MGAVGAVGLRADGIAWGPRGGAAIVAAISFTVPPGSVTAIMVAVSGMIGFVGLMMPHIARLMVGGDNRLVLPAAAILGALFLVVADIGAGTLATPNDMPIGLVTGLVGGLFFVWLLRRAARP